jgi:hypothetical protein
MSHNPYAPPQAPVVVHAAGTDDPDLIRRSGSTVILALNADLPPRCIKCNAPAEQPVKERTLYWHTPWLYLLILVGLLIYVIVALFARKSVKLHPGLCTEHRVQRRNILIGAWGAALLGIVVFAVGVDYTVPAATLSGAVLILGGIILGAVKARVVQVTRIADRIELKGCAEPFLASLPYRRA